MENRSLAEIFNDAKYQLAGHGKRNVQVLKEALEHVEGELESDFYGKGEVIERFQSKLAAYLGKASAVFFPSGTMAQQIALRIWCDEKRLYRVAYHPLCHLEIHEEDGLKELHRIEPLLLADKERTIGFEDVAKLDADIACLLLELPQREIGGQLPPFEELEAIAAHCREKGIRLHLDGARLFEILPYYGKTAAEICALFDSVYVSFYKGIGGIAGAILAGDETFAAQSKVWKRRHGGDLISLYPYIVSADRSFEQRLPKMETYYRQAVDLARRFNSCGFVTTKPAVPVSNMFHVHVQAAREKAERLLADVSERTGLGFTSNVRACGETGSYFEISIGDRYGRIPEDVLDEAFRTLDEEAGRLESARQ